MDKRTNKTVKIKKTHAVTLGMKKEKKGWQDTAPLNALVEKLDQILILIAKTPRAGRAYIAANEKMKQKYGPDADAVTTAFKAAVDVVTYNNRHDFTAPVKEYKTLAQKTENEFKESLFKIISHKVIEEKVNLSKNSNALEIAPGFLLLLKPVKGNKSLTDIAGYLKNTKTLSFKDNRSGKITTVDTDKLSFAHKKTSDGVQDIESAMPGYIRTQNEIIKDIQASGSPERYVAELVIGAAKGMAYDFPAMMFHCTVNPLAAKLFVWNFSSYEGLEGLIDEFKHTMSSGDNLKISAYFSFQGILIASMLSHLPAHFKGKSIEFNIKLHKDSKRNVYVSINDTIYSHSSSKPLIEALLKNGIRPEQAKGGNLKLRAEVLNGETVLSVMDNKTGNVRLNSHKTEAIFTELGELGIVPKKGDFALEVRDTKEGLKFYINNTPLTREQTDTVLKLITMHGLKPKNIDIAVRSGLALLTSNGKVVKVMHLKAPTDTAIPESVRTHTKTKAKAKPDNVIDFNKFKEAKKKKTEKKKKDKGGKPPSAPTVTGTDKPAPHKVPERKMPAAAKEALDAAKSCAKSTLDTFKKGLGNIIPQPQAAAERPAGVSPQGMRVPVVPPIMQNNATHGEAGGLEKPEFKRSSAPGSNDGTFKININVLYSGQIRNLDTYKGYKKYNVVILNNYLCACNRLLESTLNQFSMENLNTDSKKELLKIQHSLVYTYYPDLYKKLDELYKSNKLNNITPGLTDTYLLKAQELLEWLLREIGPEDQASKILGKTELELIRNRYQKPPDSIPKSGKTKKDNPPAAENGKKPGIFKTILPPPLAFAPAGANSSGLGKPVTPATLAMNGTNGSRGHIPKYDIEVGLYDLRSILPEEAFRIIDTIPIEVIYKCVMNNFLLRKTFIDKKIDLNPVTANYFFETLLFEVLLEEKQVLYGILTTKLSKATPSIKTRKRLEERITRLVDSLIANAHCFNGIKILEVTEALKSIKSSAQESSLETSLKELESLVKRFALKPQDLQAAVKDLGNYFNNVLQIPKTPQTKEVLAALEDDFRKLTDDKQTKITDIVNFIKKFKHHYITGAFFRLGFRKTDIPAINETLFQCLVYNEDELKSLNDLTRKLDKINNAFRENNMPIHVEIDRRGKYLNDLQSLPKEYQARLLEVLGEIFKKGNISPEIIERDFCKQTHKTAIPTGDNPYQFKTLQQYKGPEGIKLGSVQAGKDTGSRIMFSVVKENGIYKVILYRFFLLHDDYMDAIRERQDLLPSCTPLYRTIRTTAGRLFNKDHYFRKLTELQSQFGIPDEKLTEIYIKVSDYIDKNIDPKGLEKLLYKYFPAREYEVKVWFEGLDLEFSIQKRTVPLKEASPLPETEPVKPEVKTPSPDKSTLRKLKIEQEKVTSLLSKKEQFYSDYTSVTEWNIETVQKYIERLNKLFETAEKLEDNALKEETKPQVRGIKKYFRKNFYPGLLNKLESLVNLGSENDTPTANKLKELLKLLNNIPGEVLEDNALKIKLVKFKKAVSACCETEEFSEVSQKSFETLNKLMDIKDISFKTINRYIFKCNAVLKEFRALLQKTEDLKLKSEIVQNINTLIDKYYKDIADRIALLTNKAYLEQKECEEISKLLKQIPDDISEDPKLKDTISKIKEAIGKTDDTDPPSQPKRKDSGRITKPPKRTLGSWIRGWIKRWFPGSGNPGFIEDAAAQAARGINNIAGSIGGVPSPVPAGGAPAVPEVPTAMQLEGFKNLMSSFAKCGSLTGQEINFLKELGKNYSSGDFSKLTFGFDPKSLQKLAQKFKVKDPVSILNKILTSDAETRTKIAKALNIPPDMLEFHINELQNLYESSMFLTTDEFVQARQISENIKDLENTLNRLLDRNNVDFFEIITFNQGTGRFEIRDTHVLEVEARAEIINLVAELNRTAPQMRKLLRVMQSEYLKNSEGFQNTLTDRQKEINQMLFGNFRKDWRIELINILEQLPRPLIRYLKSKGWMYITDIGFGERTGIIPAETKAHSRTISLGIENLDYNTRHFTPENVFNATAYAILYSASKSEVLYDKIQNIRNFIYSKPYLKTYIDQGMPENTLLGMFFADCFTDFMMSQEQGDILATEMIPESEIIENRFFQNNQNLLPDVRELIKLLQGLYKEMGRMEISVRHTSPERPGHTPPSSRPSDPTTGPFRGRADKPDRPTPGGRDIAGKDYPGEKDPYPVTPGFIDRVKGALFKTLSHEHLLEIYAKAETFHEKIKAGDLAFKHRQYELAGEFYYKTGLELYEKLKPLEMGTKDHMEPFSLLMDTVDKLYGTMEKEPANQKVVEYYQELLKYYGEELKKILPPKAVDAANDVMSEENRAVLTNSILNDAKNKIGAVLNPYKDEQNITPEFLKEYYKTCEGVLLNVDVGEMSLKTKEVTDIKFKVTTAVLTEYYKDILRKTLNLNNPPELLEQSSSVFYNLLHDYMAEGRSSQYYNALKIHYKIPDKDVLDTLRSLFEDLYNNKLNGQGRRHLNNLLNELTEPKELKVNWPGINPNRPDDPLGPPPPSGGTGKRNLLQKAADLFVPKPAVAVAGGGIVPAPQEVRPEIKTTVLSMDAGKDAAMPAKDTANTKQLSRTTHHLRAPLVGIASHLHKYFRFISGNEEIKQIIRNIITKSGLLYKELDDTLTDKNFTGIYAQEPHFTQKLTGFLTYFASQIIEINNMMQDIESGLREAKYEREGKDLTDELRKEIDTALRLPAIAMLQVLPLIPSASAEKIKEGLPANIKSYISSRQDGPFYIANSVASTFQATKLKNGSHVKFCVYVERDCPRLMKPDDFEFTVQNFVENAINAFNREIEKDPEKYKDKTYCITINVHADNEKYLMVQDNGPGIPSAEPDANGEIPPINTKSVWTQGVTEGGTGQGLHHIKEIAESYGGRVSIESTPGVGTRFKIDLTPVEPEKEISGAASRKLSIVTHEIRTAIQKGFVSILDTAIKYLKGPETLKSELEVILKKAKELITKSESLFDINNYKYEKLEEPYLTQKLTENLHELISGIVEIDNLLQKVKNELKNAETIISKPEIFQELIDILLDNPGRAAVQILSLMPEGSREKTIAEFSENILRYVSSRKDSPFYLTHCAVGMLAAAPLKNESYVSFTVLVPRDMPKFLEQENYNFIIHNLLENAMNAFNRQIAEDKKKYTDRVYSVYIHVTESRGWIRIMLGDNGPGIPSAEPDGSGKVSEINKETIWKEGVSSASTGIGLPIIKERVEAAGGRIYENGTYGKGAQFIIELPEAHVRRVASTVKPVVNVSLPEKTAELISNPSANAFVKFNSILEIFTTQPGEVILSNIAFITKCLDKTIKSEFVRLDRLWRKQSLTETEMIMYHTYSIKIFGELAKLYTESCKISDISASSLLLSTAKDEVINKYFHDVLRRLTKLEENTRRKIIALSQPLPEEVKNNRNIARLLTSLSHNNVVMRVSTEGSILLFMKDGITVLMPCILESLTELKKKPKEAGLSSPDVISTLENISAEIKSLHTRLTTITDCWNYDKSTFYDSFGKDFSQFIKEARAAAAEFESIDFNNLNIQDAGLLKMIQNMKDSFFKFNNYLNWKEYYISTNYENFKLSQSINEREPAPAIENALTPQITALSHKISKLTTPQTTDIDKLLKYREELINTSTQIFSAGKESRLTPNQKETLKALDKKIDEELMPELLKAAHIACEESGNLKRFERFYGRAGTHLISKQIYHNIPPEERISSTEKAELFHILNPNLRHIYDVIYEIKQTRSSPLLVRLEDALKSFSDEHCRVFLGNGIIGNESNVLKSDIDLFLNSLPERAQEIIDIVNDIKSQEGEHISPEVMDRLDYIHYSMEDMQRSVPIREDDMLKEREGIPLLEFSGRLLRYCYNDMNTETEIPWNFEVFSNPRLLRFVLKNLLDNSEEADRSSNNTITLRTETEPGKRKIIVEDTAPGVPPENSEKIFEKGFTTRERGTGYGLWRIRELLSYYGWEIYLDTSYKNGARFVIEIPNDTGRLEPASLHNHISPTSRPSDPTMGVSGAKADKPNRPTPGGRDIAGKDYPWTNLLRNINIQKEWKQLLKNSKENDFSIKFPSTSNLLILFQSNNFADIKYRAHMVYKYSLETKEDIKGYILENYIGEKEALSHSEEDWGQYEIPELQFNEKSWSDLLRKAKTDKPGISADYAGNFNKFLEKLEILGHPTEKIKALILELNEQEKLYDTEEYVFMIAVSKITIELLKECESAAKLAISNFENLKTKNFNDVIEAFNFEYEGVMKVINIYKALYHYHQNVCPVNMVFNVELNKLEPVFERFKKKAEELEHTSGGIYGKLFATKYAGQYPVEITNMLHGEILKDASLTAIINALEPLPPKIVSELNLRNSKIIFYPADREIQKNLDLLKGHTTGFAKNNKAYIGDKSQSTTLHEIAHTVFKLLMEKPYIKSWFADFKDMIAPKLEMSSIIYTTMFEYLEDDDALSTLYGKELFLELDEGYKVKITKHKYYLGYLIYLEAEINGKPFKGFITKEIDALSEDRPLNEFFADLFTLYYSDPAQLKSLDKKLFDLMQNFDAIWREQGKPQPPAPRQGHTSPTSKPGTDPVSKLFNGEGRPNDAKGFSRPTTPMNGEPANKATMTTAIKTSMKATGIEGVKGKSFYQIFKNVNEKYGWEKVVEFYEKLWKTTLQSKIEPAAVRALSGEMLEEYGLTEYMKADSEISRLLKSDTSVSCFAEALRDFILIDNTKGDCLLKDNFIEFFSEISRKLDQLLFIDSTVYIFEKAIEGKPVKKVLFVCNANQTRSIDAEKTFKELFSGKFEVDSAGVSDGKLLADKNLDDFDIIFITSDAHSYAKNNIILKDKIKPHAQKIIEIEMSPEEVAQDLPAYLLRRSELHKNFRDKSREYLITEGITNILLEIKEGKRTPDRFFEAILNKPRKTEKFSPEFTKEVIEDLHAFFNHETPPIKVLFVTEDNQAESATAAAAFKNLLNCNIQDNINAVPVVIKAEEGTNSSAIKLTGKMAEEADLIITTPGAYNNNPHLFEDASISAKTKRADLPLMAKSPEDLTVYHKILEEFKTLEDTVKVFASVSPRLFPHEKTKETICKEKELFGLIAAMGSNDVFTRRAVSGFLYDFAPYPKDIAPAAIETLVNAAINDPDPMVRGKALWGLRRTGVALKETLSAFAKALKDPHDTVRTSAAQELGGFGAAAIDLIPNLVEVLDDPNKSVRMKAEDSIEYILEKASKENPEAAYEKTAEWFTEDFRTEIITRFCRQHDTAKALKRELSRIFKEKNISLEDEEIMRISPIIKFKKGAAYLNEEIFSILGEENLDKVNKLIGEYNSFSPDIKKELRERHKEYMKITAPLYKNLSPEEKELNNMIMGTVSYRDRMEIINDLKMLPAKVTEGMKKEGILIIVADRLKTNEKGAILGAAKALGVYRDDLKIVCCNYKKGGIFESALDEKGPKNQLFHEISHFILRYFEELLEDDINLLTSKLPGKIRNNQTFFHEFFASYMGGFLAHYDPGKPLDEQELKALMTGLPKKIGPKIREILLGIYNKLN
ncbi:MAG: ATP-binding protein [Armatimonadota bacterium]